MKKVSVVVLVSFFLIASWTVVLAAEMAKEGESKFKSASSVTHKSIKMDKERAEYQFETHGVIVEANENSPLYNAMYYSLGHFHIFKGAYEDGGFTRYTRPDGDHIFAVYEAKGKPQRCIKFQSWLDGTYRYFFSIVHQRYSHFSHFDAQC